MGVILSCGREVDREEVGKVKVWGRDTGRQLKSVRPPLGQAWLLASHGDRQGCLDMEDEGAGGHGE